MIRKSLYRIKVFTFKCLNKSHDIRFSYRYLLSLITTAADLFLRMRRFLFTEVPLQRRSTGKPQFGHGQLSVFVPHLGQVMMASSVLLS